MPFTMTMENSLTTLERKLAKVGVNDTRVSHISDFLTSLSTLEGNKRNLAKELTAVLTKDGIGSFKTALASFIPLAGKLTTRESKYYTKLINEWQEADNTYYEQTPQTVKQIQRLKVGDVIEIYFEDKAEPEPFVITVAGTYTGWHESDPLAMSVKDWNDGTKRHADYLPTARYKIVGRFMINMDQVH